MDRVRVGIVMSIFVGVSIWVGCGDDEKTPTGSNGATEPTLAVDAELVGTWVAEEDNGEVLSLEGDGSYTRTFEEYPEEDGWGWWEAESGTLMIFLDGGTFKPAIGDTSLTFERVLSGSTSYGLLGGNIFLGVGDELTGTDWAELGTGDVLRFESDGTLKWGEIEHRWQWEGENVRLMILEPWLYEISADGQLTLTEDYPDDPTVRPYTYRRKN